MISALLVSALLATPRPTDASLRKTYERNVATVVEVWGGRSRGAGVIVGADGQIATSVEHVGLYEAKVRIGDRELPAKVLSAHARSKIAVVQIPLAEGERVPAPAVNTRARLDEGTWLVGITPKAAPRAGRIVAPRSTKTPFITTDLPLGPGCPLFDTRGRLVAVVVARVGRIGSKALPIAAIAAQVAAEPIP